MRFGRWPITLSLLAALTLACADRYDADEEIDPSGDGVEEPSTTAATYGYSEWDRDSDRMLSREEFHTWAADRDWDGFDRLRFSEETYDLWDLDDDNRIEEPEWVQSIERWFGENVEAGAWKDWDDDGDSELDLNEVREAFETEGLYDRIDLDHDAVFDDEELGDWWFDLWDENDDDQIDTTEWDWASRYGYTEIGA